MSDLEALLGRGLEEIGLTPEAHTVARLVEFACLLARWAPRMNLTAHRDAETILRRLVLDAAAMWKLLPSAGSVVDLGSGAGVPGLPIALLSRETQVRLVESRLRRHHFQKAARRALGLGNVALVRGRIERLEPEPADLVVAQAVAPPASVLGWMLPWARPGGWVAIPGGERAPEPLRSWSGGHGEVDVEEARVLRYRVPLAGPQRSLWVARRRIH